MTDEERKGLAQQLLSNPIFGDIMDNLERKAINACLAAKNDADRATEAMRANVVRAIRRDCQRAATLTGRGGDAS